MKTAKVLMASAAASLLLGSAVQATPTVTGFYIGVQAGGAYNQFKQGFRPKDGKKDTQVDVIDTHKNSFYLGAHVGYYYEFNCGLVLGAELSYNYDFAKIKHKDDNKISGKTFKTKDGTELKDLVGFYTLEAKPQHTYGFHMHVGGKMMPNFLAYVSLGVEGNYVSIQEQFALLTKDGQQGAIWANGDWTKLEKYKVDDKLYVTTESENKTDKASVTHVRFVPGIGLKYFLDNGMYVGLQCQLPIGWNKKMDEKYLGNTCEYKYGESESTINTTGTNFALKDNVTSHVSSKLAVRYGLMFGYKF